MLGQHLYRKPAGHLGNENKNITTMSWCRPVFAVNSISLVFWCLLMIAIANTADAARWPLKLPSCRSQYAVCIVSQRSYGFSKYGGDVTRLRSLMFWHCGACSYSTDEMRFCTTFLNRVVYENYHVNAVGVVVLGENTWDRYSARKIFRTAASWGISAKPVFALLATDKGKPPSYPTPDLFFVVKRYKTLDLIFQDAAAGLCNIFDSRSPKIFGTTPTYSPATLSANPSPTASSTKTILPSSTSTSTPSSSPSVLVPMISATPVPAFDFFKSPQFNLEVLRLSIERLLAPLLEGLNVTAELVTFDLFTTQPPTTMPVLSLSPSAQLMGSSLPPSGPVSSHMPSLSRSPLPSRMSPSRPSLRPLPPNKTPQKKRPPANSPGTKASLAPERPRFSDSIPWPAKPHYSSKKCKPHCSPKNRRPWYPPQSSLPYYRRTQHSIQLYDRWFADDDHSYIFGNIPQSHDSLSFFDVKQIRRVDNCPQTNCAVRVTVMSTQNIRANVIRATVLELRNRMDFRPVFETNEGLYRFERRGNRIFIVIIPFNQRYLQNLRSR